MTFNLWLAKYFKTDVSQVECLLSDRTAIKFLIAWSLFESKCFKGSANFDSLLDFSKVISENGKFEFAALQEPTTHFHSRYQDKKCFKNLMHDKASKESKESGEMKQILVKNITDLDSGEKTLMLLIVIYRFRNNIFHGNKGVQSWLGYKDQIDLCIRAMQSFITSYTN